MFIDELKLTRRTYNALMQNGIRTVEQLREMTEYEILKLRRIGIKAAQEIIKERDGRS